MNKDHLLKALSKGVRYDGRKLTQYRPVSVETGISANAEGSARVKIGQTEVLVGVKMAIETPYPDTPEKGNIMVNVELLPLSSPKFEPGPPGIQAIELSRVVDRGIRESQALDQKALCITPGEKVWSVMIDVCPVNADGNLQDAAALGAMAALKDAVFPQVDEAGKCVYDHKTKDKLPIAKDVIEITVFRIGNHFIVDPLPVEEELVDARLTVAVTNEKKVSALQKGGDVPLSIDEIDQMVAIAIEQSGNLFAQLG